MGLIARRQDLGEGTQIAQGKKHVRLTIEIAAYHGIPGIPRHTVASLLRLHADLILVLISVVTTMCSSTTPCEIGWAEELPERCPPPGAFAPAGETYYRMVTSFPPKSSDFVSHRQLFPERIFPVSECRTRALSLFDSTDRCLSLLKLPRFRGKLVVGIALPPNAGALERNGSPGHASWWRCRNFDPVVASVIVSSRSRP
jgi:hypothetical protein